MKSAYNSEIHTKRVSVPQYCRDCAKYKYCNKCHDEHLREDCQLLEDDAPLSFRNSEGYADPTAYYALLNVDKELRAKRRQAHKKQR